MRADIAPHPHHGELFRLVILRLAKSRHAFKRKFRVNNERAGIIRQPDDAIGPLAAGQCRLKLVGIRRQRVAEASKLFSDGKNRIDDAPRRDDLSLSDFDGVDESPVRALDAEASDRMRAAIKAAGQASDTLGGIFEIWVFDPIPGLGSHVSGDARLDGRIGQAMLGIQAIKGVELGAGFELGRIRGSEAHDEIFWSEDRGYHRRTNRSGGLEGGMTHGAPLVVRAAMKPIATLSRPLASVDVHSKEATAAFKERSDICAVPAAAVIGEAVVAFVLAQALVDKFGGDSVASLDAAVDRYRAVLAS